LLPKLRRAAHQAVATSSRTERSVQGAQPGRPQRGRQGMFQWRTRRKRAMNTHSLRGWTKYRSYWTKYWRLCLLISGQILGGSTLLYAHSGAMLGANAKVSSSIILDGTIDCSGTETVWGSGVLAGTLPNTCDEFNGTSSASQIRFHALNDGANLFLAFDIPDSSARADDTLFLFFDPNHGGGSSPASDDLSTAERIPATRAE
jgi:hypothetical protein